MKKVALRLLGVLFILSLFANTNAFSQVDLSGKWDAMCVIEKTDASSIEFCDLCPYNISDDKKSLSLEAFEMDFSTDALVLKLFVGGEVAEVKYTFDDELDAISFTYKEIEYVFQVLPVMTGETTKYILKDKEGLLLFLQK